MNQQITSTGISSSTLRYLKMIKVEENPANITRVIATHFADSPIHDSMQTRMSVSDNSNPLEASAYTTNNESQIPEDLFFHQPMNNQGFNSNALLESYPVLTNDEIQMTEDYTYDQQPFGQFNLNQTQYHQEELNLNKTQYRHEAVDQLVEVTDCYEEEQEKTLTESSIMFKSPPCKRKKSLSFFNATSLQNCESFNITAKPKVGLATQALFGDESLSTSVINSQKLINEPEVLQENSCKIVEGNIERTEKSQHNSPQESQTNEDVDDLSSTLDETLMPENCRNRELEKSFMQNQKLNISTLYANRFIVNTTNHLINNFYKVHQNQDWNAIADEMIESLEPKLDYFHARDWIEKRVTLGNENQEICEQDAFSCEDIRDSLEEMEKSFVNPDHSLVASTPIPNRNKSGIVFSQEIFKIGAESKIEKLQPDVQHQSINVESKSVASICEENISKEKESSSDKLTSNVQINQTHDSTNLSFRYNLSNIDFDNAMNAQMSIQIEKPADASLALTLGNQSRIVDSNLVQVLQSQDPVEALQTLSQQNPALADARRTAIMSQIEKIIQSLLEALAQQKPLLLKIRKIKNWSDCRMNNDVLSQDETNLGTRTISFGNKSSERTFTHIMVVLLEIYKLLGQNLTCTKREIYYRDVELFGSQEAVNKAVNAICAMMNVQEFELGVLSSSKGLIAGDLVIVIGDERIDCKTTQAVPPNPSAITSFESTANYVLVVEKDTVFQRLVNDQIFDRIESKIVLITAKGYPDVNTRILLKKISIELPQLPIYILVDADPHGVEIMCTYKFGSMAMVHNSEHLAVPKIEWIGFHPSDIDSMDVVHVDLTPADLKKVDELLQRPYVNDLMRRELNCFEARQLKAEIEGIYHYSIENLINDYIPRKIRLIEMPQIP